MLKIRAPGRICLFGEHQDYLGFPVISMTFSKYIYLEAKPRTDTKFVIDLPDIQENDEILLNNKELDYLSKRDYLRSGYNQFIRLGAKFDKGYDIKITGDIPINAGCSSSSAFIIAWLFFLSQISNQKLDLNKIARLGYSAEVKEFGEAGGTMDHYTSALGNLLFLETHPEFVPKSYNMCLDNLVLGNSQERKDTVEDLRKVKNLAMKSFEIIRECAENFDPYKTRLQDIAQYIPNLEKDLQKILVGNLINRDITLIAKGLIEKHLQQPPKNQEEETIFYRTLGVFLTDHQRQLASNVGISTPKIDKMISAALANGAFGGKINGSGFGGCMFAIAPENKEGIIKAIEDCESEVYSIKSSEGVGFY